MSPLLINAGTRVAILAGGGELPSLIADSVVRRGGQAFIVAIEGEADAAISAHPHTWINFGQVKKMFAALRGDGLVTTQNVMVIAGAVKRPDLLRIRPDVGLLPVLFQVLALITAGGDDALLTKAIQVFERQGLTVVGVQDVAPELLLGEGAIGALHADETALSDIACARALLDTLGDLDVGQGAVVEGGRILAIEGVEGTDRMLQRVAELGLARRAVLLKAPKPRQERRVDLPAIGVRTVTNAAAAGVCGIAVITDEALGLQRAAMIAAADQAGVFLRGLAVQPAPARHAAHRFTREILGRIKPRRRDGMDAERGAEAVLRLASFRTGQAAAVTRGHILGVTAAEAPVVLLDRVRSLSQWGLARLQRRRGAIIVRAFPGDDELDWTDLVRRTETAGFAGIAMVPALGNLTPAATAAIKLCDAAGLFLVTLRSDQTTS
jgi:DUF1009 family protein